MQLSEVDRRILRWLRGLGSAPIGVTESNNLGLRHAASKAVEALSIAPDLALERLEELKAEGLIEIVNRPNSSSIYWTRITDDGRAALRAAEQTAKSDGERPIIFISCSQAPQDVELGRAIAQIVTDETPAVGYFAQNEATFEAVTTRILGVLGRCQGFVGIMHYRGDVTPLEGPRFQRASVWVEQEIAIAAYREQVLEEPVLVQLYVQNGIPLEGLRDKVLLNAEPFNTNDEVIAHFRSIVRDRFGSLGAPAESTFQSISPLTFKEPQVTLERAGINPDWVLGVQIEPLRYRTTAPTIDSVLQARIATVIEETERGKPGNVLHEPLEPIARATSVWLHGEAPAPQMGQRTPQPREQVEMFADGALCIRFDQNADNTLVRLFVILGIAYHMIRSLYPAFGLEPKVQATLDLCLHGGRHQHQPVLVGGRWSVRVDASQSFDAAFADLCLLALRAGGVNWSRERVRESLNRFAVSNLPTRSVERSDGTNQPFAQ